MKKRNTCLKLLPVVLLGLALPETSLSNSFYSRYGIGLLRYRDGVKAIGMGSVSFAITDSVSIFILNPATMASLNTTHIQGAYLYERATVHLPIADAKFQNSIFEGVAILFPIKTGQAIAMGLQPYSRANYEFRDLGEVEGKVYEQILSGSGGLSNAYFAFAGTHGPMRIGLALDFYFGVIEKNWRVNYVDGQFINTEDRIVTNLLGLGLHTGIHMVFDRWQFGAAIAPPVRLSAETRLQTRFNPVSEPEEDDLVLPSWFGMGLAYRPGARLLLATQFRVQPWSTVSQQEALGAKGEDSYTLGFGLEYSPGSKRREDAQKRVQFRLGATLSQLPYQDESGSAIPELTATAGLGLPFNQGQSRFDFALEYGKRGSQPGNPVEENIFRFSASVSGGERWFQRRGRR